ncbi:hypothetical protein [Mongoliimonas terrestris]|uniref:hypothetical protein n=1 Tax=Mongoliimonas terrestris TaxID=1709001 RepID=UPI00094967BB|nr:hypothetical protein [Mongoliimonas terrestris]
MAGPNDSHGKATPEEEAHRLARDPADVEGLQPEKRPDHDAAEEAGVRSEESGKPYTTEREAYGNPVVDSPTDPDQRRDATEGADLRKAP